MARRAHTLYVTAMALLVVAAFFGVWRSRSSVVRLLYLPSLSRYGLKVAVVYDHVRTASPSASRNSRPTPNSRARGREARKSHVHMGKGETGPVRSVLSLGSLNVLPTTLKKVLGGVRPSVWIEVKTKRHDLVQLGNRKNNVVGVGKVDKDHAALKVISGKVDNKVVFCSKFGGSIAPSKPPPVRRHNVPAVGGHRFTWQNPRTLDEVKQRAISLPIALSRPNVKGPKPETLRDLHSCVKPVFINRTTASVALVSLPGSGNTWIRYLIEQATGVLTGSVYGDKRLYQAGLVGENITTSQVAVVKYHTGGVTSRPWYCPEAHGVGGGVLLIRNPYDAMISEFNRKLTGSHVKAADATLFDAVAERWMLLVKNMMARFQELVYTWLGKPLPVLTVYFEDLVKDTRLELVKVVDFLRLPTSSERLDCVMRNKGGTFRRKRHPNDMGSKSQREHFLTQEVIHLTDCTLRKVDSILPGVYERYSKQTFCR